MAINREKLINYLQESGSGIRSFHLSIEYLEKQNVQIYPVINGQQKKSGGMTNLEDVPGAYSLYRKEATAQFVGRFNQTPEAFMKERQFSQDMFTESSESMKKLIKMDREWKIKKQKTNLTIKELKELGKKNQITEELIMSAYRELESISKDMNDFLSAMSKIDAGYGVLQDGSFEPTAGVPISISGAAKTSMDKALEYAREFESSVKNKSASLKRLEDYATKNRAKNLVPVKLVNSDTGKGKKYNIQGGDGSRVVDILSTFEGYISSIKGSVFEGLVLKTLANGAEITENIVREGLTGDTKGPKITEKFTKSTATTDVKLKDSKIPNQKINITVKNQPQGKLGTGRSVTTSFLSTGLNNVMELVTDRSVDSTTALRIMFAQDKNEVQKGSSPLNKIVSTAMLDFAIASAAEDRVDLIAYQEGVLPYPNFLEKVLNKEGLKMNAEVKKSDVYEAQAYIKSVLNREATSSFDFNPKLGFVFRH